MKTNPPTFKCKFHVFTYLSCKDGETVYRCDWCFEEVREYNDTGCGA
jgi:uncharacterized protein YfeS